MYKQAATHSCRSLSNALYCTGLSDVEYTITITDTVTGAVKSYSNPPHVLGSRADINAF